MQSMTAQGGTSWITSSPQHPNEILEIIGRDVFEYEISKFLQPYERFLLSSTCKWMSAIFNISNFNFNLHSRSDMKVLKTAIVDKYFRKKQNSRNCSNCIDLSHWIYSQTSRHERLCIKYLLIFQQRLPEYFPVNSFQNFLSHSLKLSLSHNDPSRTDSIIRFLFDITSHQQSGIANMIHNLHLDDIGLCSSTHLLVLYRNILCRTTNIRFLYLADNPKLNDENMKELFVCIASSNHSLEVLDLSNTAITNVTCGIIYDFCESLHRIRTGYTGQYASENGNTDRNNQGVVDQQMMFMWNHQFAINQEEQQDVDEMSDCDFSTDNDFDTS